MSSALDDLRAEWKRVKRQADQAMTQVDDTAFFHQPGPVSNSIALIARHMAGNLRSRWTDFLTTDGEKPDRDRDSEFVLTPRDTRESILEAWERGWAILDATLASLSEADLSSVVTIRGETMPAQQAILRGLTHAAYHAGQIAFLARWLNPEARWLTIPPGESERFNAAFRASPSGH
jgi:uncharacterized damage-inducible protein DinB